MNTDPTGQQGVIVTIREIYDTVKKINEKMDDELSKLKSQVAAQWVVIGIVIVALGSMLAKSL